MNRDTIVDVNLQEFVQAHRESGTASSIVCARIQNASRYGRIEISADDCVHRFIEKDSFDGPCWINGGIYLFNRFAGATSRIPKRIAGA